MIEFEVDRQSQLFKDQLEKSKDYKVSQIEEGKFSVTNDENTHTVQLEQIDDLQFRGSCDCSDFYHRVAKGEKEYCKHLIAVVVKHKLDNDIDIPFKGGKNIQGPKDAKMFHEEDERANQNSTEGEAEKKGEVVESGQPQLSQGIVAPVIDEETAIQHFQRFQRLKQKVLDDSDYIFYDNNGKPTRDKGKAVNEYICKSGWRKIALMFNVSCTILNKEKFYGEDQDGKYYGWVYYVQAKAPNGRVQDAEGVCTSRDPFFCKRKNKETGEYEWVDTDEKNIMHTAQTRGFNRAVSDLVGSGELSAEEV